MRRWLTIAGLACPAVARTQAPVMSAIAVEQIPPAGARVRISVPGVGADRVVATLLRRSGDTLTLAAQGGGSFQIPLHRISSLDVSAGKPRQRGAIRGALIGAPSGLILRAIDNKERQYCGSKNCALQNDYVLVRKPASAGQLAASTLIGAAMGAGIGALIAKERWTPVGGTPRLSIGAPLRGTMTIGVVFMAP